jgi:hypothetical protein
MRVTASRRAQCFNHKRPGREDLEIEIQSLPQIWGHLGDIVMSIVEKRSLSDGADLAAVDDGMSATLIICVALSVAMIVYVLGVAVLQQGAVGGAPQHRSQAEMLFYGP